MRIEKVSAVAEIVSSFAIVITLVYLGVQTSQNTDALLSSSRQASLDAELSLLFQLLDKPHLFATGVPEVSGYEHNREELIQRTVFNIAFFRTRENYWLQFESGAIDAEIWESYRAVLVRRLEASEIARETWKFYSSTFESRFRQEIESRLNVR